MINRRHFLQWSRNGALLLAAGGWSCLRSDPLASSMTTKSDPKLVQQLVDTLILTARDRLLETLVRQIQLGLTTAELYSALALAGVQQVEPYPSVGFKYHTVMMLQAVFNTVIHTPNDNSWLPLLWAADTFKQAQARDTLNGDWQLSVVPKKRLPPADQAEQAFINAMDNWDAPAADAAIIQCSRTTSAAQIFEWLFAYGARDFRDIGHKAITASNCQRVLNVIGWHFAEPMLRSTVYALLNHEGEANPAHSDHEADRHWRRNQDYLRQFPKHWQYGKPNKSASIELLTALRTEHSEGAVKLTTQLLRQGVDSQSLWDALILAAGELIMRQSGIISVHANTSINALHYAYRSSTTDDNRGMLLLQAVSFISQFQQLLSGKLRSLKIDDFSPVATDSHNRVQEIFSVTSDDRQLASANILHFLNQGGNPQHIMEAGRHYTIYNNTGYHDYKFTEAAFENYQNLSKHWRHRYLSASVFYLNGSKDKENPLITQAKTFRLEHG